MFNYYYMLHNLNIHSFNQILYYVSTSINVTFNKRIKLALALQINCNSISFISFVMSTGKTRDVNLLD